MKGRDARVSARRPASPPRARSSFAPFTSLPLNASTQPSRPFNVHPRPSRRLRFVSLHLRFVSLHLRSYLCISVSTPIRSDSIPPCFRDVPFREDEDACPPQAHLVFAFCRSSLMSRPVALCPPVIRRPRRGARGSPAVRGHVRARAAPRPVSRAGAPPAPPAPPPRRRRPRGLSRRWLVARPERRAYATSQPLARFRRDTPSSHRISPRNPWRKLRRSTSTHS